MPNYAYIALIPLLPLAGFVVLGLFGRRYFGRFSGVIGTGTVLIPSGLSLWTAYQYFFVGGADGTYHQVLALKSVWLTFSPGLSIDMSIILDPISVMMIVVVSFI